MKNHNSAATRVAICSLLLLLLQTVHAARVLAQTCTTTYPAQYIIAVSYVYPCSITSSTCAWYTFSNGADIVIINPASGPGTASNPDFVTLVNSIRASSTTYITTILGYVPTTYGNKSTANVEAEINKYNLYYKVDGIFFDEVATACSFSSYYSNLVDYVSSTTASPTGQDYTVLNWGTNGNQCFLQTNPSADTFVTFESPIASYSSYAPSSWMASYPASRFYNIVYNVPMSQVSTTIAKSKQTNAGRIYVTDGNGANPYGAAPPTAYWNIEVNKAAAPC